MPSSDERRFETFFGGDVEDDARIGFDRQPAVLRDFFFELARAPAGVAEREQEAFRTLAARDGFEHVFRGGHFETARHAHGRRVRVAAFRIVQHEAALGLHRAAEIHGHMQQGFDFELEVDAIEERLQIDVGRPVDHEAERAALAVIAKVDHRS